MTTNSLSLIPATLDDYPTIQNMARFYVYDMSRFCGMLPGWECPESGLYECVDLKKYFIEEDCHPFLVRVDDELAGFVMINKHGASEDVDWNVGEFFILAKFQGKGISQQVAFQMFDQFKGIWESSAIPQNTGAINLWQKTIAAYAKRNLSKVHFSKERKTVTCPEPHEMLVWRFESR
ncbi:MAG: GNAT family N-acetyltransferase [Pseudomonadota bacterium]